jgi:tetratricopeptide (TPR) repeat protein
MKIGPTWKRTPVQLEKYIGALVILIPMALCVSIAAFLSGDFKDSLCILCPINGAIILLFSLQFFAHKPEPVVTVPQPESQFRSYWWKYDYGTNTNAERRLTLLEIWWRGGKQMPELALERSDAYQWLGRGTEAQASAEEALALIEQSGDEYPHLRDAAVVARYHAMLIQGQFSEAAAYLRGCLRDSKRHNFFILLITWALFLADERDNAQSMLTFFQVHPRSDTTPSEVWIPSHYFLILGYLWSTLDLEPALTRRQIAAIRDALPKWKEEMKHHLQNPYGAALARMWDDLCEFCQ